VQRTIRQIKKTVGKPSFLFSSLCSESALVSRLHISRALEPILSKYNTLWSWQLASPLPHHKHTSSSPALKRAGVELLSERDRRLNQHQISTTAGPSRVYCFPISLFHHAQQLAQQHDNQQPTRASHNDCPFFSYHC